MKWKNKGHEFDNLKPLFEKETIRAYIWGAGTFGYAFFDELQENMNIIGFVDSNEEKQGTVFCGRPVFSPDEFAKNRTDEIVLVSTGWTMQVYGKLNSFGLKRFEDYFHIDEWYSLYNFYTKNKVCISDLTLRITEKCTLRCEHCNAFIPKIQCPTEWKYEDIIENMECLFQFVDEINILGICGGDAMSHSEFRKIVYWLGEKYYPAKVKHIEVYSNAVIPITEEDMDLFRKYDVIYRWTDYSEHAASQKSDLFEKQFTEANLKYDRARFESWYDSGYPQVSNGIVGEAELERFCTNCDRKSCHGLQNGRYYTCGLCYSASVIGYCDELETDSFNLHDETSSKMEFLEYSLGYSEKGYYNYCRLCNGGPNINHKKIEAGTQKR